MLFFDTVPSVRDGGKQVSIRLRNLRLTRAVAAADAGEVLEAVDRPKCRFEDVIGAWSAKEELRFFLEYLRNPRRYAALGLKAPFRLFAFSVPTVLLEYSRKSLSLVVDCDAPQRFTRNTEKLRYLASANPAT